MMSTETERTFDHELMVIRSFVAARRRHRMTTLHAVRRRRRQFIAELLRPDVFDARFLFRIPDSEQTVDAIAEVLQSAGAPESCHAISEASSLDGRCVDLLVALREIAGTGVATLLSCAPGKLAYLEAEEVQERYILKRR